MQPEPLQTGAPSPTRAPSWLPQAVLGAALLLVAGIFVQFFYSIEPEGRLAFDRRILHSAMQDWTYGTGMSNPPWAMALVFPFEQLPLQLTWGLLAYLLMLGLVLWIPPYKGWTRYVLLMVLPLSWITLRNYAEGNYEAFVVWGLFGIWWGLEHRSPWVLGLGLLLGTIKPQLAALWVLLVPWYIRDWPRADSLRAAGVVAVVAVPALAFKGAEWIESLGYFADERGTGEFFGAELSPVLQNALRAGVVGVSLLSGLERSRLGVGILVSGSLLISPYIGGLSMVTIMAVSVGAVFAQGWWLAGFGLLVAFQNPVALAGLGRFEGYWAAVLVGVWLLLVGLRWR